MQQLTKNQTYGKNIFLSTVAVLGFLSLSQSANAFFSPSETSKEQMKETLLGSLAFIETMQIKQRPGKQSCLRDASAGDGCWRNTENVEGEWANYIHPLPLVKSILKEDDSALIYDSNMFVTTAIAYPLYWLEDCNSRLAGIRSSALKSVMTYKRGDGFSFWPQFISRKTGNKVIGPINFRVDDITLSKSGIGGVASWLLGLSYPWVEEWMNEIMKTEQNPGGMESFMNVPNDADDTAMATAILKIHGGSEKIDAKPLQLMIGHRDLGRKKADARVTWVGPETGAYLTWLKDENLEIFATPNSGVMPLGVNNVDCVVNANVLFTLALNDMKDAPGYQDSAKYLASVMNSSQWLDKCALYYPQQYTFPYSMTRAYRDGGARTPGLDQAMNKLLIDLLDQQEPRGAWYSAVDGTRDYSTAMALVSLLNIGEKRAESLGLQEKYAKAVQKAIDYLNWKKEEHQLEEASFHKKGFRWEPGLFFAAEESKLGIWRSTALTNAIVVEAYSKFLMGYHKSDLTLAQWKSRYSVEALPPGSVEILLRPRRSQR